MKEMRPGLQVKPVATRCLGADTVTGCTGSYPIGRLTRVIEANGTSTAYCYNRLGEVSRKQLTVDAAMTTIGYSYTLAGRLNGITYPSGAQVTYGRDGDGRINAATLYPAGGGSAVDLVTSTSYEPFGPIASYTLGSGQTVTRTFDSTGQIASVSSAALDLVYNRDVEGNVTGLRQVDHHQQVRARCGPTFDGVGPIAYEGDEL
jgi:hypothetical protein